MTSLAAALLVVSPIAWHSSFAADTSADLIQLAQREGGGGGPGGGGGGGGGGKGGGGGGPAAAPSSPAGGGGPSGGRGSSGGRDGPGPAAVQNKGGGDAGRANAGNRGGDQAQRPAPGDGDSGVRAGKGEDRSGRNATKSPDRGKDAVRAYRPGVEARTPPQRQRGDGAAIARPQHRHDRAYIRQRGQRFDWSPGIAFWFYDGYYYGDCNWLKRKARSTGSDYWQRRYRQCRAWS